MDMILCMDKSEAGEWEIGKLLRQYREARALGLNQAAQYAGISKSYLSGLETGANRPNWELLAGLSKLYRVPSDMLLGIDPVPLSPFVVQIADLVDEVSANGQAELLEIIRVVAAADKERQRLTQENRLFLDIVEGAGEQAVDMLIDVLRSTRDSGTRRGLLADWAARNLPERNKTGEP